MLPVWEQTLWELSKVKDSTWLPITLVLTAGVCIGALVTIAFSPLHPDSVYLKEAWITDAYNEGYAVGIHYQSNLIHNKLLRSP